MQQLFTELGARWRLVVLSVWLLGGAGRVLAQAPPWGLATAGSNTQAYSSSFTYAVAADASGNVFVTGGFIGQVAFGNTVLTNAGNNTDLFVAKYVPSAGTWAWAVQGGGVGFDQGYGIAVSGSNVYVTGIITNSAADAYLVTFGGSSPAAGRVLQYGATDTSSQDLFVAKYHDEGASATLGWTQVAGGTSNDFGAGIAASGPNVYVTGELTNNLANEQAVRFGGSGATLGTVPQYGATSNTNADIVVAKYTDHGNSAAVSWTQIGGGTSSDYGQGIAVSGTSVYVTGALINNAVNTASVRFGGSGPTPGTAVQYGASSTGSYDLVVAKYTDNGNSAALGWTQVGGGMGTDIGYGIAASGPNVYITGCLFNNIADTQGAHLGGSGPTPGVGRVAGASPVAGPDLLVAKYLDNGPTATLVWTQVGGGTDYDFGQGIAVRGTNVYVTGFITSSLANAQGVLFGGNGTAQGTSAQAGASSTPSNDLVVASYTDNGPTATLNWTQVAGGPDADLGLGIVASPTGVYVGGTVLPPATFGSLAVASATSGKLGVLAGFGATALPVRAGGAGAGAGLVLFPNPAGRFATLSGAVPGGAVRVLDALGRLVATARADASGTAVVPAGLPSGVYVVRTGQQCLRFSIQ